MKNSKIALLFVAAVLFFASCVKDNSTTNFNEMNKITIEGLESAYEVTLGHKLTITPTVTYTDNDVSFIWYTYSRMSGGKRDTLSTKQNLDVVITGANGVPGEEYKLVYRITDNKTGVFESKEVEFRTNGLYTKGLLMLCEKEGNMELDMLLADKSVLENIYSLNNGGEMLTKNYREVAFSNPNPIKTEMKQIFLFADQADGGVVLDPITLTTQYTVREMFEDPISEPILSVSGYSGKLGNIDYVTLNGKLCKRTVNMGNTLFQTSPLVVSNSAKDFSIGGFVNYEHEPIVYDDMNGRILAHAPWNKGTLIRANPALSGKVPFDADNMGNYALLATGTISKMNFWMLMRERTTNEVALFKFIFEKRMSSDGSMTIVFTPLSKTVITSVIAPNIDKNSVFVSNTKVANACFYISNNKLYSLNISSIPADKPVLAELELAAPVNMTLTGCRYYQAIVPDPKPENPNATRQSDQIRVMVQNNSLSTLKGGVIYYEIKTVGGIGAIEVLNVTTGGFCDRVVDMVEKDS